MASNSNNLNAGMRCIKYMLFLINVMFVLTACLLLAIAFTIQGMFGSLSIYLDDHFNAPATLFIVIACLLLIIALFGCFGALKESTCMINIYGVFLTIVFILEIAAAISAIALKRQVGDMLNRTMYDAVHMYPTNTYVANGVDFMQLNLGCCGVSNGPEDWSGVLPDTGNSSPEIVVPASCCNIMDELSGECVQFYTDGCFDKLHLFIRQSTVLLSISALAVAFVQLLGLICAFMLAGSIRRTKSLREARRWQLQQSIMGLSAETPHYKTPYSPLKETDKPSEPVLYVPTPTHSTA